MKLPPRNAVDRYFHGRHVLITGGSQGIGFALARRLTIAGAELTLLSRSADKLARAKASLLTEVPAARVETLALDVSDAGAIAEALPRALGRPLDVLINNAGVSRPGYFSEIPTDAFSHMMKVNFEGTLNVTRALLPALERTRGHVVNIGSLSSVIATLGHSGYCSSKFALYGLSDVLRAELRPRGIRVSVVLPPETETNMLADERPFLPPAAIALQESAGRLSADEVARATLRGVARDQFEIVPGWLAKAAVVASRVAPGLLRSWSDWVIDEVRAQASLPYRA